MCWLRTVPNSIYFYILFHQLLAECQRYIKFQVVRILESETSGSYLHKILVKAKRDIASVQELITFADFL